MKRAVYIGLLLAAMAFAQNPPNPGGGSGTVTSITCPSGTITTSGMCSPITGATTGAIITAGGATGPLQTLSANATVDSSGNVASTSITTGGPTPTASGGDDMKGLTSGGVALVVADVAGTAIVYVLPTTNGAANKLLTDTGVTTCPTLAAGFPTTCHLLSWSPGTAQINTLANTSGTTWLANNGTNLVMTPPSGGGISLGAGSNVDQFGDVSGAAAQFNGFNAVGTTFTASGCTVGTLVGGATAGTFKIGANGPCTVTITTGSSQTAANGWTGFANNTTRTLTASPTVEGTGSTITVLIPTGALANDVYNWGVIRF